MAILAFSTTASFSTECEFSMCEKLTNDVTDASVKYEFGYPFSKTVLEVPVDCENIEEKVKLSLPFDFSNAAEFYVATGVLSFLYALSILVVYICFHQNYANNTKLPVMDLVITVILSVFWLAGSSAWAQGVIDLKFYLRPATMFTFLLLCVGKHEHECQVLENGSYGTLNASLILGFANFLLWVCSMWFVYKETVLHTPEASPETNQNQTPKGVGKV
ncbi:synaptoporin-like [Stegodyphus dumicola]|uniref:synaptoporin-like n=1 Tax=Stegodyphus dumicola TaxID=202533 RepID=UPI0015AFF9C5|nr:synaptoporin-like [Stegodyphus dumicola]